MVTYFDVDDMASFGAYMLSQRRKNSIINNPEVNPEEIETILKMVTQFDLEEWIRLTNEAQPQPSTTEISDEPLMNDDSEVVND